MTLDEITAKVEPSTCSCDVCQHMCEQRPCWGTPAEAKAIIDAGFGKRLMRDYWISGIAHPDNPEDIDMLQPAIVGYEGTSSPWWPEGRCTFLTKEGLCELHALGLKPIEGRLANHDESLVPHELHEAVAASWENDEAQALVRKWEVTP